MGDPRTLKKKYKVPKRIWDSERISEERSLVNGYGLKNMREVWIAKAELRKIRRESRRLLGLGEKGKEGIEELLKRAVRMRYVPPAATLDDVLSLTAGAILERRLQTLVFRLGLANSLAQARQLITHGHISVNERKTTAPGMLIPIDYEHIAYYGAVKLPVGKLKKEEKREAVLEERLKEKIEEIKEIPGTGPKEPAPLGKEAGPE